MFPKCITDPVTYEGCGTTTITKAPGVIYSPGYPGGVRYLNNMNCEYNLILPSTCVSKLHSNLLITGTKDIFLFLIFVLMYRK